MTGLEIRDTDGAPNGRVATSWWTAWPGIEWPGLGFGMRNQPEKQLDYFGV